MLKVRGTTVYPAGVFAALQEIEEVCNYCLEVYQDYELSDCPRVIVGLADGANLTREEISRWIRDRIRVTLDVVVTTPDDVSRRTRVEGRRKPTLVFDYRTKGKERDTGNETA